MAANYWIKLYMEILDDPKMGRLPCNLWRRFVECCLMAGESREAGFLPDLATLAWRLRVDERTLHQELTSLADFGLLELKPYNPFDTRWFVVNFAKRQAASSVTERVKRHRERNRNTDETKRYKVNAPEEIRGDKITEEKGDWENPSSSPYPETPLEASRHPDMKVFRQVSGVIPGLSDYKVVIDAVRLLRKTHPHEEELETYLLPFWLAWESRKTKDGKPFGKTNPTWLTEWAVNNTIPAFTNGQRPIHALEGMTPV